MKNSGSLGYYCFAAFFALCSAAALRDASAHGLEQSLRLFLDGALFGACAFFTGCLIGGGLGYRE